ncbi:hypothetical protein KSC_093270 [Ktedonobacter sp. SOSP1-52]|nr:hypothetical protein KSC_019570 [Ktedonobacter sp. SOSP1-52]GHO70435.1 hypothetical protein KSC_093270 [Ktedonobacter sp. SOSP1-52]
MQPVSTAQMQAYQFLIAMHQMLNGALTDRHASLLQHTLDMRSRTMLSIPQIPHVCNEIQATFPVRKRPSTFFFGSIRLFVRLTGGIGATANDDA